MTKYQVRVNVYFDDEVKANILYKYLEGLKSDYVKFTEANDEVCVSKFDLIKNEHDGEVYIPCSI